MRIAIVGAVGVPGRYGGFETLAENLVRIHAGTNRAEELVVYCSRGANPEMPARYLGAELRYVGLDANGALSVPYDTWCLIDAVRRGTDVILLLGVSGAFVLPVLRMFSRVRIVTNIDGIEWKRGKWKGFARWFLRWSEEVAIRFSHIVIADNRGIAEYVSQAYGRDVEVIEYGGDHAVTNGHPEGHAVPVNAVPVNAEPVNVPHDYVFALCRIEPENNVEMTLEAFAGAARPLVFVGNWSNSGYGRRLHAVYGARKGLILLGPIYDPCELRRLRGGASAYIHGHSAGGTNPALVEMMHFGIPVFAFDCVFNRYSTENAAIYFSSAEELKALVADCPEGDAKVVGDRMLEIARRRYTWGIVGARYFDVIRDHSDFPRGVEASP